MTDVQTLDAAVAMDESGHPCQLVGRPSMAGPRHARTTCSLIGMSEHFGVASGMPGVAIRVQELGLAVPGSSVR